MFKLRTIVVTSSVRQYGRPTLTESRSNIRNIIVLPISVICYIYTSPGWESKKLTMFIYFYNYYIN